MWHIFTYNIQNIMSYFTLFPFIFLYFSLFFLGRETFGRPWHQGPPPICTPVRAIIINLLKLLILLSMRRATDRALHNVYWFQVWSNEFCFSTLLLTKNIVTWSQCLGNETYSYIAGKIRRKGKLMGLPKVCFMGAWGILVEGCEATIYTLNLL